MILKISQWIAYPRPFRFELLEGLAKQVKDRVVVYLHGYITYNASTYWRLSLSIHACNIYIIKEIDYGYSAYSLHAYLVFSQHSTRALSHHKRTRLVFYFLSIVTKTSRKDQNRYFLPVGIQHQLLSKGQNHRYTVLFQSVENELHGLLSIPKRG